MKLFTVLASMSYTICCNSNPKTAEKQIEPKDSTFPFLKNQMGVLLNGDSSTLDLYSIYPSDSQFATQKLFYHIGAEHRFIKLTVPNGRLLAVHNTHFKDLWIMPGTEAVLESNVPLAYSFDTVNLISGEVFFDQTNRNKSFGIKADDFRIQIKGSTAGSLCYSKNDSAVLICTKGAGTLFYGDRKIKFKGGDRLSLQKPAIRFTRQKMDADGFSNLQYHLIRYTNLSDFMEAIGKLFNKKVKYQDIQPKQVEGVIGFSYTHSTLEQISKALNAGFGLDCTVAGDTIFLKKGKSH